MKYKVIERNSKRKNILLLPIHKIDYFVQNHSLYTPKFSTPRSFFFGHYSYNSSPLLIRKYLIVVILLLKITDFKRFQNGDDLPVLITIHPPHIFFFDFEPPALADGFCLFLFSSLLFATGFPICFEL